MRESGGKLVYEMRAGIKTMKEELRKQAKKEKRSNVLLFVSRGLFIYCTFVCFYVFVLDHVYLYSNR
jgi:aspartate/tyrosine/aromatic aminotransferase